MRLKIKISYLRYKTRNKCTDFRERMEKAERGEDAPPLPLLSCEWSVPSNIFTFIYNKYSLKLKWTSLYIPQNDIYEIILQVFLIGKRFFGLSFNFLNITLEIRLRFSEYFFLTFISLLFLILYLIRFNTNNKHHFLDNGETIFKTFK